MIASSQHRTLPDLIGALLQQTKTLPAPTPEFTYSLGWYPDYETLFREDEQATSPLETLAEAALTTGRVILSGRGGGAKSEVLRRLALHQLERGRVVSLVDLKRWSKANVELWDTLSSAPERVDFLLTELGTPGLDIHRLNAIPENVSALLLIDGLNEVSASTGQQILASLEQFVRYAQNLGVIVADRLVRRSFPDASRWRLASVLPLDVDQIRALLRNAYGNSDRYDHADGGTHAMLANPYFLGALLRNGSDATTIAELIRERFIQHAGLQDDELSLAAQAAFEAYRDFGSRTFPLASFEATTGPAVVEKLFQAGLLSRSEPATAFDHHLTHDFLAAAYTVADEKRWDSGTLDAITFGASSFDALALAVQQINDAARADVFVRRVYDWNIYGAAYALTEGRPLNSQRSSVSLEMEAAMLAMLAVRQRDLIISTRTRARDALNLFPKSVAEPFLKTEEDTQVVSLIEAVPSSGVSGDAWFPRWKEIFIGTAPIDAGNAVACLEQDDIFGWTFANAVRRVQFTDELRRALYHALDSSADATIRWRIVHALGMDATISTADALVKILQQDSDTWVRYGAVRALIEIAALGDGELREHVFRSIGGSAGELREQGRIVRELKNAVAIDPLNAPAGWLQSSIRLIETFYELEPTLEARIDWERLAYELRGLYEPDHAG